MLNLIIDYIRHNLNVYGVISRNGPPAQHTMMAWVVLKQPIIQRQCPMCLGEFWGRENGTFDICGRFTCYRKSKNSKKLRHQL